MPIFFRKRSALAQAFAFESLNFSARVSRADSVMDLPAASAAFFTGFVELGIDISDLEIGA
jgi:hypothetical protein